MTYVLRPDLARWMLKGSTGKKVQMPIATTSDCGKQFRIKYKYTLKRIDYKV